MTFSLFICFYMSAFCLCSVKVNEAGHERQSREKWAVVSLKLRARKSRNGRRAGMEHERLNFPNKGWNYFVSVLESKSKTKRAMESLP